MDGGTGKELWFCLGLGIKEFRRKVLLFMYVTVFVLGGRGTKSCLITVINALGGGGYSLVVSVSCEGREGEMLGLVCGLVDEYDSTQDG